MKAAIGERLPPDLRGAGRPHAQLVHRGVLQGGVGEGARRLRLGVRVPGQPGGQGAGRLGRPGFDQLPAGAFLPARPGGPGPVRRAHLGPHPDALLPGDTGKHRLRPLPHPGDHPRAAPRPRAGHGHGHRQRGGQRAVDADQGRRPAVPLPEPAAQRPVHPGGGDHRRLRRGPVQGRGHDHRALRPPPPHGPASGRRRPALPAQHPRSTGSCSSGCGRSTAAWPEASLESPRALPGRDALRARGARPQGGVRVLDHDPEALPPRGPAGSASPCRRTCRTTARSAGPSRCGPATGW